MTADIDCDLPYSGRRSCRVDHILTLENFNIREVIPVSFQLFTNLIFVVSNCCFVYVTVVNAKYRINTRFGRTNRGNMRSGYLSVDVRQLATVVADNKLGIQRAGRVTEVQSRRGRNRQVQPNCRTPVCSLIS